MKGSRGGCQGSGWSMMAQGPGYLRIVQARIFSMIEGPEGPARGIRRGWIVEGSERTDGKGDVYRSIGRHEIT